ncbi:hypothetical protein HZA96_04710 [Candidatus Woesearchaeota archaeon]|nr:hypothetical protein [Candidatus Woesearchaeota archaeon]
MDKIKNNKIENGISIVFQDVSIDGESCIFLINSKTYVIEKGELETIGKVKIWVKDIYPVRSKEQESDICVVLVAGIDIKKESTGTAVTDYNPEIKIVNNSKDAIADKQSNIIPEIVNNQNNYDNNNNNNESNIIVEIINNNDENNAVIKKGVIERIIDFFRNLFG